MSLREGFIKGLEVKLGHAKKSAKTTGNTAWVKRLHKAARKAGKR